MGNETSADFTATINWGDMTTSVGQVVSEGGGAYEVNANAHTYATAGSYTETVTIKHDLLPAVTSTGQTIVIADKPVAAMGGITLTPLEGLAFTNVRVATFIDPAGAQSLSNYSATIDWGDGTSSSAGAISAPVNGVFTVTGSHTFIEEGTYAITVTINHGVAPPTPPVATTMVLDTAIVADQQITGLALVSGSLPATANENVATGPLPNLATFTDPAGVGVETPADFTATHWGDNTTSSGTVSLVNANGPGGAVYQVNSTGHTYVSQRTFAVSVTVQHDLLAPLTTPVQTIAVGDQVVLTAGSFTTVEGKHSTTQTVATFTDPGGAQVKGTPAFPISGAYTAYINWGDGTVQNPDVTTGTITYSAGTFSVLGSHTYSGVPPTNAITVTVTHGIPTPVSVLLTPTVSIPSVLVTGGFKLTGTEGAPLAAQTVAIFTDPAGAEQTGGVPTVGAYSADIDWTGTGNSYTLNAGTISYNAANKTFVVTAAGNVFPEFGTYSVLVRVNHLTSAAVVVTDTAKIADAPLTLPKLFVPTATEGEAFGPAELFTFMDANTGESASAFTATVSWGDGTTSTITSTAAAGNVIVATGGGGFEVEGAHTYANELTGATFKVSVADQGGAKTSASGLLNVADPSVILQAVAAPTAPFVAAVNNTSAKQVVATFTDPGGAEFTVVGGVQVPNAGAYHALINWGDGTLPSNGTITLNAGVFSVSGTHKYTTIPANPYNITVTVSHGTSTAVSMVTDTCLPTSPKSQTITFPQTPPQVVTMKSYTITVTLGATASSGLPVTYSVVSFSPLVGSNSTIVVATATLNGDVLTITGKAVAGGTGAKVVVEADQLGGLGLDGVTVYSAAAPVRGDHGYPRPAASCFNGWRLGRLTLPSP